MNTLIYMVKAALYLAGFYLVFFIFLANDTKYGRNRAFIILSVISSFILPLITVNIKEQSSIFYLGKTLSEVIVTANGNRNLHFFASGNNPENSFILIKIYLTGIIVFSLKLFIDIINLFLLIIKNKINKNRIIYFNGFNTSGFSAMGYIFINRCLGVAEAEEIIRHEQNHLESNHFLDIFFIEVVMIFQWFNPIIYLFNRSLRAIHEYQADQGCLKSGMTVISYQNLLLNNVFRSKKISITNSFSNPSLIKKRMIMMSKEPSGNFSSLKLLVVIPVIILFLSAISACEKSLIADKITNEITLPEKTVTQSMEINQAPVFNKPQIKEVVSPPPPPPPVPGQIFVVVEEMPTYPGGDKALMEFINSNIKYPEEAKNKLIQGRVILRFAVMASGKVGSVSVLKSVDPSLDEEAKRVIEALPEWKPGRQGGKPVNVWYSVPVTFQLK
jgi:TonB family protein